MRSFSAELKRNGKKAKGLTSSSRNIFQYIMFLNILRSIFGNVPKLAKLGAVLGNS